MSSSKTVKIKAFKATDNPILCENFIEGHRKVLKSYNVPKITSDSNSWKLNEDVYVIVVETLYGEIVGGARIHIKNTKYKLPIEEAFYDKHNDFKSWIDNFQKIRIGEMCGLWNAKTIAGSGLSTLLTQSIMAKSGIILANQLKLNTLFCLCAPWTVELVKEFGFSIAKDIGNKGSYPYPKPNLPATVMYIDDTDNLPSAMYEKKKNVLSLRRSPIQEKVEKRKNIEMKVYYNLVINNL